MQATEIVQPPGNVDAQIALGTEGCVRRIGGTGSLHAQIARGDHLGTVVQVTCCGQRNVATGLRYAAQRQIARTT